eukprot:1122840-Prymnesium_polylepis.2
MTSRSSLTTLNLQKSVSAYLKHVTVRSIHTTCAGHLHTTLHPHGNLHAQRMFIEPAAISIANGVPTRCSAYFVNVSVRPAAGACMNIGSTCVSSRAALRGPRPTVDGTWRALTLS